jgi:uncharacterized phage protein (TIGR01671 family)
MKCRVWDEELKKMWQPEDICRLNFSDGELYGATMWDGDIILEPNLLLYTGLKDKNGKETWENDIVKWQEGEFECNYKIFWSDINGWWYGAQIRGKETPYSGGIKGQELHQAEIIGNLFENPKLLEKL